MYLVIVCLLLTVCYVVLMALYSVGWARQKEFVMEQNHEPGVFLSIVIPARDEAANIAACIESILAQRYPARLYEVIVVDDHSGDDTAAIIKRYTDRNVTYVSLAEELRWDNKLNAYKKAAIAAGIAKSRGELIVTTDADCVAGQEWLAHMAAIYERSHPDMIVAPVVFSSDGGMLQVFQRTDFMSMQGITAAAHSMGLGNMSNGANLAFSKEAFTRVNGYEGIQHLASGDDYLLMMKIKNAGGSIAYLRSKEAIVTTAPQPDWGGFLQQRIRWASKSGKYNDSRLTAILLLVYLFNLCLFVAAIAGVLHTPALYLAAAMLLVKIIVEYVFIIPVSRFFNTTRALIWFPFLQPLHVLYIVSAGFMGLVGGYKWKGRRVK